MRLFFSLQAQFREGFPALGQVEQRVVAEARTAPRVSRGDFAAGPLPRHPVLAVLGLGQDHDGAERWPRALARGPKLLHLLRAACGCCRRRCSIARRSARSGPRAGPFRASDLQARIVRQAQESRMRGRAARLLLRIGKQGLAVFHHLGQGARLRSRPGPGRAGPSKRRLDLRQLALVAVVAMTSSRSMRRAPPVPSSAARPGLGHAILSQGPRAPGTGRG